MIPPVTVTPAPSGRPIVYGTLTLKRLAGKSRKNVLLSHPQTTEDIRASFELLQKMGGRSPKQGKPGAGAWSDVSKEDIEVLGNLSAAAVGGSPIFILAGNPRTFLHFSQILRVLDEEAIGVACCITIETGQKEYKFSVDTSVDYQIWIAALRDSFQRSLSRKTPAATNPYPMSQRSLTPAPTDPPSSQASPEVADSGVSSINELEQETPHGILYSCTQSQNTETIVQEHDDTKSGQDPAEIPATPVIQPNVINPAAIKPTDGSPPPSASPLMVSFPNIMTTGDYDQPRRSSWGGESRTTLLRSPPVGDKRHATISIKVPSPLPCPAPISPTTPHTPHSVARKISAFFKTPTPTPGPMPPSSTPFPIPDDRGRPETRTPTSRATRSHSRGFPLFRRRGSNAVSSQDTAALEDDDDDNVPLGRRVSVRSVNGMPRRSMSMPRPSMSVERPSGVVGSYKKRLGRAMGGM